MVWHNQRGPAMAFSIPPDPSAKPEAAHIKGGPWPKPWRQLESKGATVSWEEWAEALTHGSPYFGWWSVEEVPDSVLGVQGALEVVQQRAGQETLT
jgi:hypothetical protein